MTPLSAFQQMIQDDIRSVFLNLEEFGSLHVVEGKEISIILAPDQNISLSGGYRLGVAGNSITIYAAVDDLPKRKESGQALNLDGREYIIDKWNEHQGIAEILLNQHHSI